MPAIPVSAQQGVAVLVVAVVLLLGEGAGTLAAGAVPGPPPLAHPVASTGAKIATSRILIDLDFRKRSSHVIARRRKSAPPPSPRRCGPAEKTVTAASNCGPPA
jgi:hypothetical protein